MKLSAAFSLLISVTGAAAQLGGRHHPAHMWMFGENGVQIFTPDGSEEVKSVPPEKVCKETTNSDGSIRVRCDFRDVISDGRKYVWAAVARGVPMIDVFRIDTGDLVGSFATCGSPERLDYHPLREEVWVHCAGFSDTSDSHLGVFSAANPTASIPAAIALHNNTALRSSGRLVVDGELGDSAYSTVYGHPHLYKIQMAERRVLEQYDVIEAGTNPKFFGLGDMAFSPKNGHLYLRAEVCCTCGFEGADNLECGRYGSSNITLNIDGNEVVQEGQCGSHCRGGPTDTMGVLEFDAATGTVVGTHELVGSAPVEKPFSSPDGEHIVMFGMNGGKTVEILKAGSPGFKSSIETVLTLDFNTTNVEDRNVFDDFAYIQSDGMNLFVVASSSDYKVAIVNMDDPENDVSYVMLKDVPYTGRARGRQVEHAEGTDYVWVAGRNDDEVYVINVRTKELVKTYTEVDGRKLVSVKHHAFVGGPAEPQPQELGGEQDRDSASASASESTSSVNAASATEPAGDDGNNNALSIAALVMSCVAIAAVLANFVVNSGQAAKKNEALPLTQTQGEEASVQAPPSVQ